MENSLALQFLQAGAEFPKVYWKSRGANQVFAGYGVDPKGSRNNNLCNWASAKAPAVKRSQTGLYTCILPRLRSLNPGALAPPNCTGYRFESPNGSISWGGRAFSSGACQGVWSGFPLSLFFSPAVSKKEIWQSGEMSFSLPHLVRRRDTPSKQAWVKQINDALGRIRQGDFKKVVLARQTTLSFDEAVDPYQVMRMLNPLGEQTSLFLLQIDPETTFLGASPEKLFHRKDRTVASEALAGTKDLLEKWSPKEIAEAESVQMFLNDKFLSCCNTFEWLPPEQKTFGNLNHLYQGIVGTLKEEISDEALLTHLHPTPALGGFPQQEALHYISQIEPFHRGWYGSPFGLVSSSEADVAVAIRSALIIGSEMHLFAGGGIVEGSIPEKEWEECDKKIAHFLRFL